MEVPILDVSPLTDGRAGATELRPLAASLAAACRDVGFFYIERHGIPQDVCDRAMAESRRFFALPLEEKMKLHMARSDQFRGYVPLCGEVTEQRRDWHECIDLQPKAGRGEDGHPLDDPEQWPESLPAFRLAMMDWWNRMYRLGERLAYGLALSIGLDGHHFETFAGPALCALRLSHYPPFPAGQVVEGVDAGMGAHCDNGFLTLLQQDRTGGLQIRNAAGQWQPAPHIPGTLLVNIGLMMQRWTNDRYRATLHTVLLPAERSRYSMPFFFEPRHDAVVEPLPVCCDADNPPRYAPCLFGEYLTDRFSKAYKADA